MVASKAGFPFPLQLGALDWFVHPRPGHVFERPAWRSGEAMVANGYVALRVARGYWAREDFEEAPAGFWERFDGLPWSRFEGIPDEWRALDDIRGLIYRDAPTYPWTEKHRAAPSRVWRMGGSFLGRLSHLQLIARLPRSEVHLGVMGRESPLLFRFNGGLGMLAADPKLTVAGFEVWEPRAHFDGVVIGKNQGPCVVPKAKPYWADFE